MRAIEGGIATHDDEAGEVVGGCRSRDRDALEGGGSDKSG
jgi:hypothetical protein